MKRFALIAAAAPLALGLLAPATTPVAAGVIAAPKRCVGVHVPGYGKLHIMKRRSQRSARRAWRKRIANGKFGRAYAQWTLAKRREIGCARVGSKWQCTARAIPCSN